MHGILVVQPRMKPAHLPVLAALVLLGACTPMQWVRDDATTPAQLDADAAHCQQEAWREARLRAWAWGPPLPILMRDAAGRPFVSRHYSPFHDPFGDPFFEESRLAQFCMRAKGYRLEPVEKAETIQPSPENASGGKP